MEPVRHLNRLRRALGDPFGVLPGADARDNLHARVLFQPARQGLCPAVREQGGCIRHAPTYGPYPLKIPASPKGGHLINIPL